MFGHLCFVDARVVARPHQARKQDRFQLLGANVSDVSVERLSNTRARVFVQLG